MLNKLFFFQLFALCAFAQFTIGPGSVFYGSNTPILFDDNYVYKLIFQPDDNLVVYRIIDNRVMWATDISYNPNGGGRLEMQNDSNLVIYNSGNIVPWDSDHSTLSSYGPGSGAPYMSRSGSGCSLRLTTAGRLQIYKGNTIYWTSKLR